MSLAQVQKCLFDYLRALEAAGDGPKPDIKIDGYVLTDEEATALREKDIGKIYAFGVHPVILNGYCRALGYKRDSYRPLLEQSGAVPARKKTRWQKS